MKKIFSNIRKCKVRHKIFFVVTSDGNDEQLAKKTRAFQRRFMSHFILSGIYVWLVPKNLIIYAIKW